MGNSIQRLTSISDGTLLICCRQSVAFRSVSNRYDELDTIRTAWRIYIANHSQLENFESWVPAWRAFEEYSRTDAVDFVTSTLMQEFDAQEQSIQESQSSCRVFRSKLGLIKLYANGLMRRGVSSSCFAATFLVNDSGWHDQVAA